MGTAQTMQGYNNNKGFIRQKIKIHIFATSVSN